MAAPLRQVISGWHLDVKGLALEHRQECGCRNGRVVLGQGSILNGAEAVEEDETSAARELAQRAWRSQLGFIEEKSL